MTKALSEPTEIRLLQNQPPWLCFAGRVCRTHSRQLRLRTRRASSCWGREKGSLGIESAVQAFGRKRRSQAHLWGTKRGLHSLDTPRPPIPTVGGPRCLWGLSWAPTLRNSQLQPRHPGWRAVAVRRLCTPSALCWGLWASLPSGVAWDKRAEPVPLPWHLLGLSTEATGKACCQGRALRAEAWRQGEPRAKGAAALTVPWRWDLQSCRHPLVAVSLLRPSSRAGTAPPAPPLSPHCLGGRGASLVLENSSSAQGPARTRSPRIPGTRHRCPRGLPRARPRCGLKLHFTTPMDMRYGFDICLPECFALSLTPTIK